MNLSLFTTIILFLVSSTCALPPPSLNANLQTRQSQEQPLTTTTCADYARLANYTAIDSNSTIRAAFLQGSPQGTDPTRVILDRASTEFTAKNLMFDRELNTRCGNLSTVALREVGTNFSSGVVGPFKVVPPTGVKIGAGLEVWTGAFIVFLFVGFGLSV